MARLLLVTGNDPEAQLRHAAAPFCRAGAVAEPLPLLVLRQGGLRDAVHQLAAASGADGWLGRPIVVFAELPGLLGGASAPLDSFEREALLRRAISRAAPPTLGGSASDRTLVPALDRLFGDLVADGIEPAHVSRALAALEPDAWEAARDADLAALYDEYLAQLRAMPARAGIARTDGRDDKLLAAAAIRREPELVAARLRRPLQPAAVKRSIDVYGLADLRRGWRPLLDALRDCAHVEELRLHLPDHAEAALAAWAREHAHEVRPLPAREGPVPVDERADRGRSALAHLRASLFDVGAARAPACDDVRVLAAPDTLRELQHVAREIKRLLIDGDAAGHRPEPHEIAVVARKARPHLTGAAQVLADYGIPVQARLRHALNEVPAVAALLRAFRVAGGGWTMAGIAELSSSPYFDVELDLELLRGLARTERPRGLDGWRRALDAHVTRAGAGPGAASDADDTDDADGEGIARRLARATESRDAWEMLAAGAAHLDGRHTLAEWLSITMDAVGGVDQGASRGLLGFAERAARPLAPTAAPLLRDALRLDVSALRELGTLLASWRTAGALDPAASATTDAAGWASELERVLAEHEVTVRTGAPGGVQLLEALAAEGRSFAHVFLVGASVGSFPSVPAGDALLADSERERLHAAGVPTEPVRVWLEREGALFRELARAPRRSLHLSYAYADAAGAPQLPAAYVDDVAACFERDAITTVVPGSRVAPEDDAGPWSEREALLAASLMLRGDTGAADAGDAADAAARLLSTLHAGNPDGDAIAQLLHATTIERVREGARAFAPGIPRAETAHAFNGRIEDPALLQHLASRFGDRVWSATQLETYGRCPFTFLGKHVLHARALEEAEEEEVTGRDLGTVMHAALAATYARLLEHDPANPLTLANFPAARGFIAAAVGAAVEQHGGAYLAIPALRAARERELVLLLEAYVHWEMRRNEGAKFRRRPLHMELAFGLDGSELPMVQLALGDRTLKLRGQIDRVDEVIDPAEASGYRFVVDHKAGGGAFNGLTALRPAGGLLQLELYIQAVEQLHPGAKIWGGAYQLVRGLEPKAGLERCSVTKQGMKELGTTTQQKHDEAIREAARVALSLVDGMLAGHFPAKTPDGVTCLSYCEYRDACREDRVKRW